MGDQQIDWAEILRKQRLSQMLQDQSNAAGNTPPPVVPPQQVQGDPNQPTSPYGPMGPMTPPQMPTPTTPNARQQYQQFLQQQQAPQLSDYHPSLARRILAPILGGIAGAAGYPAAGGQFLYQPFNQQISDYQNKASRLKEAATEEGATEKQGYELRESEARRKAEESRQGAEEARRQAELYGTSELAHTRKMEEITAGKSIPIEKDLYDIETYDGRKIVGARYDPAKGEYVGPDNQRYGSGAIKSARPAKNPEVKDYATALEGAVASFMDENGRPPKGQEYYDILKKVNEATGQYQQRTEDKGDWSPAEDMEGNPIEYNRRTGATRPSTIRPAGTKAKADAADEKEFGPARKAMEYADDYMRKNIYTGVGDEALMDQFFELSRPSSGFRMTDSQINMLKKAQNVLNSISAKAKHMIDKKSPWFSDDLRRQIYVTMRELADAKLSLRKNQPGQSTTSYGGYTGVTEEKSPYDIPVPTGGGPK